MALPTDDISAHVLSLAWKCLSETSRARKCPDFDFVFPTRSAMENTMHSSPYEFAPGLLQIIQSSTAPTISEFKNLPPPLDDPKEKLWAVYLLVLEKDGHCPRIYVGSGTCSEGGVRRRMSHYNYRSRSPNMNVSGTPYFVDMSLKDGYAITHKCLLSWTPLPPASKHVKTRSYILLIETVFTLIFWAMKSQTKDYFMPALCPWSIEGLEYHGCCTHFSLNEHITGLTDADHDATPEEIDRAYSERKKLQSRMYIANKGPGVHAANTKKYGDKALEEQRFECTVCVLSFRSKAKLVEHEKRSIHIRKAAGIVKLPAGRGGSQLAVTNRKYWCEACQHAASTQSRLSIHLNGPRHAKKLTYLALAEAAERLDGSFEGLENGSGDSSERIEIDSAYSSERLEIDRLKNEALENDSSERLENDSGDSLE